MKLILMRKCLGGFLIICSIISCTENEPVEPGMGFDYYPLRVGRYLIYQVQENTNQYELKVTMTDSTINDQGVITYVLVREKRTDSSVDWQSMDTWSVKIVDNKMIQNEGNVLYVKLSFPPSVNLKWNGNQFNRVSVEDNPFNVNLPFDGNILVDSNSDHYVISEQQTALTLPSGFESDNTITVMQNNFQDNIIGTDQRMEIYAKGVGLVYKEINQFLKCSGTTCSGDKSGLFIQSLKEYGQL